MNENQTVVEYLSQNACEEIGYYPEPAQLDAGFCNRMHETLKTECLETGHLNNVPCYKLTDLKWAQERVISEWGA